MIIGVETDRGLLVEGLVASGYAVFAINPFAASRYRDRHVTSGAKSDPGDANILPCLAHRALYEEAAAWPTAGLAPVLA